MTHPHTLRREGSGLILIDMQERFAGVIPNFEEIAANVVRLVRGFGVFGLPVIPTEQYPRGLGRTVEPIRGCLEGVAMIEKMTIACTLEPTFVERLSAVGPDAVVVCGIESHVCVNQTVLGLLERGLRVHVPVDAIGSRKTVDHHTALRKMEQAGAIPTTTEMCLFELAERAGTPEFKAIQALVK